MSNQLLQSYNVFLNTANRDVDYTNLISGGTPNFLAYAGWYLKKMITKTKKNSYFTISVKHLILPFTFHSIGQLNNNFVLTQFPVSANIICNQGNPNITELLADIKAKILLAIPTIASADLTFTYSSAQQTVSILNNTTINLDFNFSNNYIGKILGFTTNIVVLANGGIQTSNININVNQLQNVYVRSDNLTFTNSYESIVNKNDISDIITIIPIQVSSGNYIVFTDSSNYETRLGDEKIDFLSLYLTSAIDDDHVLNLTLDWTVHLQINEYSIQQNNNINFNPTENTLLFSNKDNIPTQEEEYLNKRKIDLENQLKELNLRKKMKNTI